MSKAKVKNGKTSSQDYVNLIYSDSDSESVPDLNLPQLKGKKQKVKTKTRRNPSSEHTVTVRSAPCSPCLGLQVVMAGVVVGSLLGLGVMCYWLTQQIADLKSQVTALENRHTASPEEVHELQTKLTAVDTALTKLRSGDSGLQALNRSITSMQAQIATLSAAQQQQKQSMQQAANGQGQNDFTKTVTDLGSDLQTTKAELKTVKDTQASINTELTALTTRLTTLENPGGREKGSTVDTSGLELQMTQLNSSLSQSIAKAVDELKQQQTHIEAVDKFLQTLQDQMTSVQHLTTGLNHSHHIIIDALGSFSTDSEMTQFQTEIKNQVDDLYQTLERGLLMLEQMKEGNTTEADPDLSSPPPSQDYFQELLREHQDYMAFKAEMYQDINSLNVSVSAMNISMEGMRKDVGELSDTVSQTVANVTDLSHTVHQALASLSGDSETTKSPPQK